VIENLIGCYEAARFSGDRSAMMREGVGGLYGPTAF
jgi:hypothetical protein